VVVLRAEREVDGVLAEAREELARAPAQVGILEQEGFRPPVVEVRAGGVEPDAGPGGDSAEPRIDETARSEVEGA
jgi:hypothetical protein